MLTLLRWMSRWPLWLLHAVGAALGWLSYFASPTYRRRFDANVAQAERLYDLVSAHSEFMPAVQPRMSAMCLRYAPKGLEEPQSAKLHATVARQVEESGRFWISTTVLKGRTWFRVNPVNIRTRLEHMDELFDFLVELCAKERANA